MAIDTCCAEAVVAAAAPDAGLPASPHAFTGRAQRVAAWIRHAILGGGSTPAGDGATLDHGWVIDRQRFADRGWER